MPASHTLFCPEFQVNLFDVAVPAGSEDVVSHHDGHGEYAGVDPGTADAAAGASCWLNPVAAATSVLAFINVTRASAVRSSSPASRPAPTRGECAPSRRC